jgi:beta-lactamase superfamily II metal-dependent hydrolase
VTLRMTMYPALDGDCLLLTWGNSAKLWHMIIDLGRGATYKRIRSDLKALGEIELLVISHVDADHIAGVIPLIREDEPPFTPKRVWYNARPQLIAARNRAAQIEPFGARQGEKLARGLVHFGWPWNREFVSEVVSTDSGEAAVPIRLDGGLTIRLLSPNDVGLIALIPNWDDELRRAKLRPFDPDADEDPLDLRFEPFGLLNVQKLADEDYSADPTEANGTAIALLAEFDGKRILLAADAHSETLEAALRPLAAAEGGRYKIDLLKVSHHGSKANTSKIFPTLIDCSRFSFSTNGDRHDHPDPQTIARFLTAFEDIEKTLYFNYRQPRTEVWNSVSLKTRWKYECVFPVEFSDDPANGLLAIDV